MIKGLWLWVSIMFIGGVVSAQSVVRLQNPMPSYLGFNTTPLKQKDELHSPKKATIMSAILPGLGQMYNEKYWKIGVIYATGFVMSYGMKFNVDSLKQYQRALNARVDTSAATIDLWYPMLSDAKVTGERDYYRRNRDMLILGFIGLYALQIIDANVDAHLKEFEINKDLSMKINPDFRMYAFNRWGTGMSLAFRF